MATVLAAVSVFSVSCGKGSLPVPNNISIDTATYNMTWDAVEGARGYMVTWTDGSGVSSDEVAHHAEFSLERLMPGDYEIRVKAVGESGYSDSEWSEALFLHKEQENGCVYVLIDGGTAFALSDAGSATGDVVVGDTYRGLPVTEISDDAFWSEATLTSVVIGNNVTSIGNNAFFGCAYLTSVTIPESVTSIGEAAFQACYALESIAIPDGVTALNNNIFNFCRRLKNIRLPSALQTIGDYAFANCSSLDSFVVPDSVVSIGSAAFLQDTALTSVTFGKSLVQIGGSAFTDCTALDTLVFAEESSLREIGTYAFSGAAALESVSLPEGVETIGYAAFLECTQLRSVELPSTVTEIEQFAFLESGLYNDALENDETYVYADDWLVELVELKMVGLTVVGDSTVEESMQGEGFVPLRGDIVGIADAVFSNCGDIARVFLPDSVEIIGNSTFWGCSSLWYFEASDNSNLRVIGSAAFMDNTALSTLYLGNALETIETFAFYGCEVLTNNTITSIIPQSVTSIGMLAFFGTQLYENPDEYGVVYAGNWAVGYEGYDDAVQYMAALLSGQEDAAAQLEQTLSDVTYIQLRDDTRGIADYAFYGHANLEQMDGMSTPRYMGMAAFLGCARLGTINLNRSMTEIPDYAFYGCERVASVSIPVYVERIGRSAFNGCSRLNTVSFSGNRLETIDAYAFYGCINLPSIQFGTSLTEIGDYAFYNCVKLDSVALPDTLASLGERAFFGCSGMTSLDLGNGITEIGDYAFGNCTGLTSVSVPDSVTAIGNYAFYGCSNVTELDLGSVQTIGNSAFARMLNLKGLVIPSTVRSIGDYAFRGCSALTSVILRGSVEHIGVHAFYGCNNATVYTDAPSGLPGWDGFWNSSFRPVVWGVTLSEDGSYVVSVTVGGGTWSNVNESIVVSAPERSGYTFGGWAVTEGGEAVYGAGEIGGVREGTTLYAVWLQI